MGTGRVAVIGLVAGCYAPHPQPGAACAPGDLCPAGLVCVQGICERDPGAPGDPDAANQPGIDAAGDVRFAAPMLVGELQSGGDDYGPTLTADGLHLMFNSERDGDFTLYAADRADIDSTFSVPARVAGLDAMDALEYDPELSAPGTELHFFTSAGPAGVRRIERASIADPWGGSPVLVTSAVSREGPTLALSDLRMAVSEADGSGIHELARPDVMAPWELVLTHDSLAEAAWPALSADGLEIFVTRNGRIYRATRAALDEQFGDPARVHFDGPLDTAPMVDPELSPDGRTMYLSIDAGASYNIYVTTR